MTPTLPENAVETTGLSKTYVRNGRGRPVVALDSVDLAIPRGSFFGLLGPNGAGKSTLINILAGLVIKTSGSARVWGFDTVSRMRAARRAIGIVPQELNIDPFFTPRELLEVQAGLYGVPLARRRTDEILETIGLTAQAEAYTRTLSGGMRRRLLVGKAMVHTPPVLVLDEPTAGVDIELRHHLWNHVRELNRRGTTVLLTTHYLEEAEELCDRIAIINHGRLITCDTTQALLRRLDAKEMSVNLAEDLATVPDALGRFSVERKGSRELVFRYSPSKTCGGEILAAIQGANLTITEIATREANLADIFLRLTRQSDESTR